MRQKFTFRLREKVIYTADGQEKAMVVSQNRKNGMFGVKLSYDVMLEDGGEVYQEVQESELLKLKVEEK